MPTLAVERDDLFTNLNRTFTEEEFEHLCFEFGVELDEVTSEREEAIKAAGTTKLSKKQLAGYSSSVIYKIDVPANRYDLLCVEGLGRSLRIFLGDSAAPNYRIVGDVTEVMTVVKSRTSTIRPFVVCAVLRNMAFDPKRYQSFIELQDQLHRNLCRQRTLVAIGTHDLDAVQGPFVYDARPGEEVSFVPLTHGGPDEKEFTAKELLEVYETDAAYKHLKPYVPIIKDSPLYPVVLDSQGTVLSLPPIINGDKSKITLDTKNVFIECTATDLTKANIVLDTMVTMFSEYAAEPFTVEPVRVDYLSDTTSDAPSTVLDSYTTPLLSTRHETAGVNFINSLIGINTTAEHMVQLCDKMQLGPATIVPSDDESTGPLLRVTVPPTRSDILHAVDIAEDVGIAFGYNNIVRRTASTNTVGASQPLATLGDLLRDEIGRAGYTEVLTHGLSSLHDNFTALGRSIDPSIAVALSNPANVEYQVVRTTLLPGLLKTLQHNRAASFADGFKLFEISDIVLMDREHVVTDTIVGARNHRRVCAVYAGPTSGFEIIHGLVDRIMALVEVQPEKEYIENSAKGAEEQYRVSRDGWFYTIRELVQGSGGVRDEEAKTYFPNRAAEILLTKPGVEGKMSIGTFGILHPQVLGEFDIQYPSSCLEMDLECLL